MYGFRKVYQLNLSYDESAEKRTVWQFKHEYFRKDEPEKLCDIKRRASKNIPAPLQNNNALNSTTSPQLPTNNQGTEQQSEAVEAKLAHFAKRLQHVDNKRKELWEQTIKLSDIQVKQQKVDSLFFCFLFVFFA